MENGSVPGWMCTHRSMTVVSMAIVSMAIVSMIAMPIVTRMSIMSVTVVIVWNIFGELG